MKARVVGHRKIDRKDFPIFDHRHLVDADFSGQTYSGFHSIGSKWERCNFENLKIQKFDADFSAGRDVSEYIECRFDGARMSFGHTGPSRFMRCSFRNVDFRRMFCHEAEMIDCVFSGRLRQSYFNGTVLDEDMRAHLRRTRNEFHGNDFSAMQLIDVDFRTGIDLTKQRLPTGPEYLYIPNAAEALEQTRCEVVHWPDLELRRKALFELGLLEKQVDEGQKQLFLRAADIYGALGREVVDSVYGLLRTHAK